MSIGDVTASLRGLTIWGDAAVKTLDAVATSAGRVARGVGSIPDIPTEDGPLTLEGRRARRGITVTDSIGPTDNAAPPNYLALSMGSNVVAMTVARVEETAARVETLATELSEAVEQVTPFSYARALQDSFRDAMPTLGRVMTPNLTAIMQRAYTENTPKVAAEVRKVIEETLPKSFGGGGGGGGGGGTECGGKPAPANGIAVLRLAGGLR
jgi:hypothetical protein